MSSLLSSGYALSLDEQVSNLCVQFGKDAVQKSLARQSGKKRGRPQEDDYRLLEPYMELDARDLLNGIDPKSVRSNYSIAVAFANKLKGHSHNADVRRLCRKLKDKRRFWGVVSAYRLTLISAEFGYKFHLAAIDMMEALPEIVVSGQSCLGSNARKTVDDYRQKFGEISDSMTFMQLSTALRDAVFNQPLKALPQPKRTGIFGRRRVTTRSLLSEYLESRE